MPQVNPSAPLHAMTPRRRRRYRPSDLTNTQKQAVLDVIDTGGLNDVISSLYQLRTVRALHRKRLVRRVTLKFAEGDRLWWALTADGRVMRKDLQDWLENWKANRR